MSRSTREAQLRALHGKNWGANIITEMGGPKRDRRKMLEKELAGSYEEGTLQQSPDLLLALLTGSPYEGELEKRGAQKYPGLLSGGYDKPTHAFASQRMAERFGAPISTSVGMGKELFTGALSKLGGGDFFGPGGFDWKDIGANYQGIARAEQGSEETQALEALLRQR